MDAKRAYTRRNLVAGQNGDHGAYACMDYHSLARKDLQSLCKKHGIPANKSNFFMADALAKKRVPLAQLDGNQEDKKESVLDSPIKAALPKKSKVEEFAAASVEKASFRNNFLAKGKRKDVLLPPSALAELTAAQEKVKSEKVAAPVFPGPSPSSNGPEAAVEPKVEPEPNTAPIRDENTEEKVRLQHKVKAEIDAYWCSKVKSVTTVTPSLVANVNKPSESVIEPKLEATGEGTGVFLLRSAAAEQSLDCFPFRASDGKRLKEEFPVLATHSSEHESAATPPLRMSPLIRMKTRLDSIADRLTAFWGETQQTS